MCLTDLGLCFFKLGGTLVTGEVWAKDWNLPFLNLWILILQLLFSLFFGLLLRIMWFSSKGGRGEDWNRFSVEGWIDRKIVTCVILSLVTWCEELTHWKGPWYWERLKAGGEGNNRGWDGWMASPTRWTWVWASSGCCQWTGGPGVLQSLGSQRVGHDSATELNCIVLKEIWFGHTEVAYTGRLLYVVVLAAQNNTLLYYRIEIIEVQDFVIPIQIFK